ncbi:MAG: hypothetical protein Q9227_009415, partial [Pyrenula ochraceoflavens]
MDDLSGLSWNQNDQTSKKPPQSSIPAFTTIRPTPPISGRSTPLSAATPQPPSKPATPANDTFSNLVSFSSSTSAPKNLSLQEQQKKQAEARVRQVASGSTHQNKQYEGDAAFWENLGSGRSTPAAVTGETSYGSFGGPAATGSEATHDQDEEDLLAGFKADAPVDTSSHFPRPGRFSPLHSQEPPAKPQASQISQPVATGEVGSINDDDDPFGLADLGNKGKTQPEAAPNSTDGDDVLGLLAQPLSNFSKPPHRPSPSADASHEPPSDHPQDRAVAELVDMGFPPEKARRALESTENGLDVQGAVGWLLNQAHSASRQKVRSQSPVEPTSRSRQKARGADRGPAWMGDQAGEERSRERAPAQVASEFSATFMKTAGSLWKAGSKKVQQAMQDFNTDGDPNQPKWMREASPQGTEAGLGERSSHPSRARRHTNENVSSAKATDEVLMLESDAGRPAPRKPPRKKEEPRFTTSTNNSRDHSPAVPSSLRGDSSAKPSFLRQQSPAQPRPDVKSTLNRKAIEEEAASAYVSSARRRPKPIVKPALQSETDLLDTQRASSAPLPRQRPAQVPAKIQKASTPVAIRPAVPQRKNPPIDPSTLASSHKHRLEGSAHFKRGDYSAAHSSYASALRGVPQSHPLTIILLTNHALTSLKVGEPKQAVSDCDNAISVIGPSQGTSESIDLQNGEPPKPMREFHGKALMRKAEALEQMERWADAAAAWRNAVSAGHGGSTSIQGRQRCEKAAGVDQSASAPRTAVAAPAKRPVTTSAVPKRPIAVSSRASDAAVSKLRAANAAAEKADDEKFRLADSVDAKIEGWRGGKADNLRALLSSLDKVLWPEAGWKNISMADLVLPGKVKVQYMKGIAKVHPDKEKGLVYGKTAFERMFPERLAEQEERHSKRRKLALAADRPSSNLDSQSGSDQLTDEIGDIDEAISRRRDEVYTLIRQYAKDNDIIYAPFLSREEEQLHILQSQVYRLRTDIIEQKGRELFLQNDKSYGTPRWYKPLSKPNRIARLRKKFLNRQSKAEEQMKKEKFAVEWHLNYLRFHFLPFFLDTKHSYQNDCIHQRSLLARPNTARKLLLSAISSHPIRECIFDNLSAYDIAKVFHVLFPQKTKEAVTNLIGKNQIDIWMNPLRDIFNTKQMSFIADSLRGNKFSRESIVIFGPDAETLQRRLWDVPGFETCRSTSHHKLRIFLTWSHSDRQRAWRHSFGIDDTSLSDDIFLSRPGNDGEPHQGIGLRDLLYCDWGPYSYDDIYGRTLRLGCPDPDIYAEQIWSDTVFYWTPQTLASEERFRQGDVRLEPRDPCP